MTIVKRLRDLITAKGESPIGVMTIEEGVNKLQKIEDDANPLSDLTIDTEIAADENLLGKVIADLQADVVVGVRDISGTLIYIDDYTGFSGDSEEQVGHYLAIHASVPGQNGVTISIKHSAKAGSKNLDADGILIFRITDALLNQDVKLTFTASKSGYADYSKTFGFKGLVLAPPEDD